MKLSDRERKTNIAGVRPAAQPGESAGAIRALAKTWITKYPDGHALVKDLEESKRENPFADFRIQFGKHAGSTLRDVPVSYLIRALHNFDGLWPATREAIERYLALK